MSLIFAEGFDWVDTSLTGDNLITQLTGWGGSDLQVSGTAGSVITGRLGGNAISMGSVPNHRLISPAVNPSGATDGIIGFAFLTPAGFNADIIFQLRAATSPNNGFTGFQLRVSAGGVLSLDPHDINATEEPLTTLNPNQWYYIEIRFDLGTTNFANMPITVNLDGVQQFSGDLQIGDDDGWNSFQLNGANWAFDDFYVCSTSGPINNDILGPITIRALVPDADSTTTDFTASSPGDHFTLVDELGPDGDSTYVESSGAGQVELYSHEPSAPSGSVIGVVQTVTMRATDVTPVNVQFTSRSGGVDTTQPIVTIGSQDYNAFHQTYDLDPSNSAAWTEATLDATEFGITRT